MPLSFWPNLCSKASTVIPCICTVCEFGICTVCEFVKSHLKQDGYDDCITKDGAQLGLDATPNEHKGIEVSIRQHTSAYVSNRQH